MDYAEFLERKKGGMKRKPIAQQRRFMFKRYRSVLTVDENRKGVLDIDTVKGCRFGMEAHPRGGCYGCCYARKLAELYGFDFSISVTRKPWNCDRKIIESRLFNHRASWFRIGTMGDPCHDWSNTTEVCEWLGLIKIPVIISKHWVTIQDQQLLRLAQCGAVINTSVSPLDTDAEITHRLKQFRRIKEAGLRSVLRIVSVRPGKSPEGRRIAAMQSDLFSNTPIIDNPLRVALADERVTHGDILTERHRDINGLATISIFNGSTYVGRCDRCPDQCGVPQELQTRKDNMTIKQKDLFVEKTEFIHLPIIIGSGYEKDIATLAIEDGIAKRAARKNMQIHSAIVLKVNDSFAGFFTFQVNHVCREFCLLQSVIKPIYYTDELYQRMTEEVIKQNTKAYPAIITTDPKSKFETPELFERLGFQTYLKMSGFHYMVQGTLADVRMKLLAHITMTNVWNSVKGDWLNLKRDWNARIEAAGEKHGIPNPTFATREGCWQGESGFSNVVNTKRSLTENGEIETTTKAHNGNASVLDPVACEVIARFFMPKDGGRIYNPFGGGVQFGYVSGACGFEYIASEIRQNQCDANNKLCSEFGHVRWIQSDSSVYEPEGLFDLIFTCPPYYKVEEYLDYDGQSPAGEINSLNTYDKFKEKLFAGYEIAISRLSDNRFFVVMTGDSRDKDGAYYCSESETELFFKEHGLAVYNKVIYLECEFTRLAQAKKTLNYRKFPKREQKIIVAYKGDISEIIKNFQPIGRL